MSFTVKVVNVALAFFALWLLKRVTEKKPLGRPIPGPKGWPIIGNLFDVPTENEYKVFTRWRHKYGDLIQLTVFGRPTIVINSKRMANDMFSKKSSLYSSRPHLTMACDLVGWKDALVLLKYTDRFKSFRRMFHTVVGTRVNVDKFRETLEEESALMARRLLDDPGFDGPVRKAVGAIILRISHGYRPKPNNDPMVRIADQATDHLNLILSPGRFLVDVFPFLRFIPEWLPGGGVHKVAREMKHTLIDLTNQSYQYAQDQIAKGTATPSFVSTMLEGRKVTPGSEEEHEIKWAASSLYTGGADTPVLATASFLLAMTMHPDIQKKAQEELDAVIGPNRLPTLADRDSLPYLNTMLKEAIRWGPTTPLGAPHCIEQDDVHEGYFIPKGSIVMANIWWFMHDPEVYKNPMKFDPERLVAKPGKPAELDPFEYAFGYGRRA